MKHAIYMFAPAAHILNKAGHILILGQENTVPDWLFIGPKTIKGKPLDKQSK